MVGTIRWKPASQKETYPLAAKDACSHHVMESVCGKNAIIPHIEAQSINFPKYSFHQIDPKYSFQQIEPTGKSSDVLNIQW